MAATRRGRSKTPAPKQASPKQPKSSRSKSAPRSSSKGPSKPSSKLSKSSSVPSLAYADGKPKPYFRGYLHGLLAAISGVLTVAVTMYTGKNAMDPKANLWWGFTVALFGKFLSYAASAMLHLFPFKDPFWVTEALKADLVCITLSVGFTALAFTPVWSSHSLHIFGTTIGFMLVNLACVHWTFSGHVGLETPKGRSEVPRNIALVLQFLNICYELGEFTNYSRTWVACTSCYVTSFLFAGPVTASHSEEPMGGSLFFWHKLQRNGLHEDFHNVLAIADAIVVYMAFDHIRSSALCV
jgi:hypothetical protein